MSVPLQCPGSGGLRQPQAGELAPPQLARRRRLAEVCSRGSVPPPCSLEPVHSQPNGCRMPLSIHLPSWPVGFGSRFHVSKFQLVMKSVH